MKTRFHGPGTNPQASCDLVDAQVSVEAESDHDSMVRCQLRHRRPQDTPFVQRPKRVLGRDWERGRKVMTSPPRSLAQPISARIDDNSIEPALEQGMVAERVPISPGGDEGVVSGVLRLRPLPQDGVRQSITGVEVAVGKRSERIGSRRLSGQRLIRVRHDSDLTRVHCRDDTWRSWNVPFAWRVLWHNAPTTGPLIVSVNVRP